MKQHVCKYALARFLPYRDTEEFVNVGVVLLCEQLGYLSYLLQSQPTQRIAVFFEGLDEKVYREGIRALESEIARVAQDQANGMFQKNASSLDPSRSFEMLTKPRKTLFCFGEPRVLMTENPANRLQSLFEHYVRHEDKPWSS